MKDKEKAAVLQSRLKASQGNYRSVRAFSEDVGIKEPTLYKWLNSKDPVWPDEPSLRVLAQFYGTTIEGLTESKSQKGRTKEVAGVYRHAKEAIRGLRPMPREEKAELIRLLLDDLATV